MKSEQPVVVLGAGINGAAVARELVLNRVPVVLVDTQDIAAGATSRSSRLVHGGLRYLEYGDIGLVRESLVERERLLELAPHFVRPLQLFIPVERMASGLLAAGAKFLRTPFAGHLPSGSRGLWLVRTGLAWYDQLARSSRLPRHTVHPVGAPGVPPVNARHFRWLCSYYDAQMAHPERFVVALLHDAERIAAEHGIRFSVFTYHQAQLSGKTVTLHAASLTQTGQGGVTEMSTRRGTLTEPAVEAIYPAAIINATGAWVDLTLDHLNVPSRRLMGGTKGSHFFTRLPDLRAALGGAAIYAEAADGRPVFLLPLGDFTMVGTTDLPIQGDPASAATEPAELEYLVDAVRRVFPQIPITEDAIDFHCCGVRPLPVARSANPAAITRRHTIVRHSESPVPLLSLVGGKLTTCRQLGEEVVDLILSLLDMPRLADTRSRPIPYPGSDTMEQTRVSDDADLSADWPTAPSPIDAMRQLCGSDVISCLRDSESEQTNDGDMQPVPGTLFPRRFVRHLVRDEWCTHLQDLATRRLMLPYTGAVTDNTLRALADIMQQEGRFSTSELDDEIEQCRQYLRERYGIDTTTVRSV